MERNFPIILSELRKEKGLSQKEAAAKLGISQALLSHYEKGIRECGQSFLIRAADFYGVTCDYLLGRSAERNDTLMMASTLFDDRDDINPTSRTLIKAAIIMVDRMRRNEKLSGVKLEIILAIALYKIILIQADAGNLPKNWAGRANVDGEICCSPVYFAAIEKVAYKAIAPTKSKTPDDDAPVPDSIKTLVNLAEDFIMKHISDSIPPMPPEFFR